MLSLSLSPSYTAVSLCAGMLAYFNEPIRGTGTVDAVLRQASLKFE